MRLPWVNEIIIAVRFGITEGIFVMLHYFLNQLFIIVSANDLDKVFWLFSDRIITIRAQVKYLYCFNINVMLPGRNFNSLNIFVAYTQ